MRALLVMFSFAMVLSACGGEPSPKEERNPLEAPPVDSARIGSVEQVAAWGYHREVSADLDGNGAPERIVIASDVTMTAEGAPLWEDGHRWGVYVVSPDNVRTLLYSAFVPNGSAEAAVLAPDNTGHRRVLIQERTPQQMRVMEVEYVRPGVARSSSAAYYQLGEWLPGTASVR